MQGKMYLKLSYMFIVCYFLFIRNFIRNYFNDNTITKVVWCVCDGLDKDKTILISFKKMPNFISRSIVKVHGYQSEKLKDVEIENMMKKHREVSSKLIERKV